MTCQRFIGCLMCLAITSLACADGPDEDHKRVPGDWRATVGAWNGTSLTAEQLRGCKLYLTPAEPDRLEPAHLTLRVPDKLVSFQTSDKGPLYITSWDRYDLHLDPAQSPKRMGAATQAGFMRIGFEGIYQIDGDTLKVCFNLARFGAAPKDFKSPPKSGVLSLVLKRAK